MNNIPIAEEFVNQYDWENSTLDIASVLREFAKLHVEAALKTAAEKAEINFHDKTDGVTNISRWKQTDLESISINQESILNAYPKENIK